MTDIPEAARWRGGPSPERQRELETNFFCDNDNKRGFGHGALFHKVRGRWILFTDFRRPQPPGDVNPSDIRGR